MSAALRRVHLQRRVGGRRPPAGDERAGGFGRMVRNLGERTGISWTRGQTRSSTRRPTVTLDSPTSLTRMPQMPTGDTFGGTWSLTRKRSPIWSCTGAERRSPPPCCRGTGGSRWRKRPSPCRARCWQRMFPCPTAGRHSRRRKSNAPSCP